MSRSTISMLRFAVLLTISVSFFANIHAQDNNDSAKAKRRGPLPFYFGKLGVNDEQRDKLYTIQESYETKLEALRKQMKALLAEREAEMVAALTPGQKLRLQELKVEAKKSAKKGLKPAPAASE